VLRKCFGAAREQFADYGLLASRAGESILTAPGEADIQRRLEFISIAIRPAILEEKTVENYRMFAPAGGDGRSVGRRQRRGTG